jgi:hypothetical protein
MNIHGGVLMPGDHSAVKYRGSAVRRCYPTLVIVLTIDAVTFLRGCEADGMKLENCPAYVCEWMDREKH